jgi:hypothetical protein
MKGSSVYEVVVSTDDGYFTVVATNSLDDAEQLVERGNSLLWDGPRDYLHFEVKKHEIKEVDAAAWTRQDFIDAVAYPEPEDWFTPESEEADR